MPPFKPPLLPHPSRLFHSTELSSSVIEQLPLTVSHMVECVCQCCSLNLSHPFLPPLCSQVCSLLLCLYSCSANRFISTIFLEGICLWSSTTGDLMMDKDSPHSLPPPHSYYTSCHERGMSESQCQGHWVKLPNLHTKKLGDFPIHHTLKSQTSWINCHQRKQKLSLSCLLYYTTARCRSHFVIFIIINSYTASRICDTF